MLVVACRPAIVAEVVRQDRESELCRGPPPHIAPVEDLRRFPSQVRARIERTSVHTDVRHSIWPASSRVGVRHAFGPTRRTGVERKISGPDEFSHDAPTAPACVPARSRLLPPASAESDRNTPGGSDTPCSCVRARPVPLYPLPPPTVARGRSGRRPTCNRRPCAVA